MDKDFFEFARQQYQYEMKENEGLYQKAALMLILLPLLCTAIWQLGGLCTTQCPCRMDVFLYYLATIAACVAVSVSWVFLFILVMPRDYKTLAKMDAWWEYWGSQNQRRQFSTRRRQNSPNNDWRKSLCERMVEAQPINALINETRRKAFHKSVLAAAFAVGAIGVLAVLNSTLRINGILP